MLLTVECFLARASRVRLTCRFINDMQLVRDDSSFFFWVPLFWLLLSYLFVPSLSPPSLPPRLPSLHVIKHSCSMGIAPSVPLLLFSSPSIFRAASSACCKSLVT